MSCGSGRPSVNVEGPFTRLDLACCGLIGLEGGSGGMWTGIGFDILGILLSMEGGSKGERSASSGRRNAISDSEVRMVKRVKMMIRAVPAMHS